MFVVVDYKLAPSRKQGHEKWRPHAKGSFKNDVSKKIGFFHPSLPLVSRPSASGKPPPLPQNLMSSFKIFINQNCRHLCTIYNEDIYEDSINKGIV